MRVDLSRVMDTLNTGQQEGLALLDRLLKGGERSAAFGEPITRGEHTVVPVSSVSVWLGYGFGGGGGAGPTPTPPTPGEGGDVAQDLSAAPGVAQSPEALEPPPGQLASSAGEEGMGAGGGGGGGGYAHSRPVGVVTVGPEGVRVRPILDWMQITLALMMVMRGSLRIARALARRR